MIRAGVVAALVVLAAPAAKPAPPLAPLAMLPSVARVRVVVGKTELETIEEVNLPRGEWHGEALDFYVAFGAPGPPRAIDVHLVPVGDGSLEPADDEAGDVLATERAPRRPPTAHPLLGRDTMAGIVVHVRPDLFAKALAPGNMAALRIRTAIDLPEDDPSGGKSVLVRLGSSRGQPLTLGRVVVHRAARADAHLCGPDADTHALAVGGVPKPADSDAIAPVLALRHASDDLCVRVFQP